MPVARLLDHEPDRHRRASQRRGRALPAHLLDAAALERRDAACACSSPPTARWARACTRWPTARSSTSAPSSTAVSRLPEAIAGARLVVMGQSAEALIAGGLDVADWPEAEAPARRRRWYVGARRHARGAAGERLRRRRPGADAGRLPDRVEQDPPAPARRGDASSARIRDAETARGCSAAAPRTGAAARGLGQRASRERLALVREHQLSLRIRMLGGTNTGYARMTRRWWAPVQQPSSTVQRACR